MPIIKPIPRVLLNQNVEYEKFVEGDDWSGGPYHEPSITLENVRVQYSTDLNRNNNSEDITYKALLFFDMTHSRPKNVEFTENSKVNVDGQIMYIKEIHPIRSFKLHHYELVLV